MRLLATKGYGATAKTLQVGASCLLASLVTVQSQTAEAEVMRIRNFTSADGLGSSLVSSLMRDSEGDRFTFGKIRSTSTYVQPVFSWLRTGLTVSPLVTINQTKSEMGYGLRISGIQQRAMASK